MSKTIYCGECEKFAYEDTDGFGFCLKTNEECRCSDKCHIIKVAPVKQEVIFDYLTRTPKCKASIMVEKDCIYHQALNKKNFIKILKRYGYTL